MSWLYQIHDKKYNLTCIYTVRKSMLYLKIEANEGQSAQCIYEHIYGSIRQLTKRDLERSLEDIVCVYEV